MANKMTKGTIAVAAGAALLLGGAGTYAWWSVSEAVDDQGTIQSGDLNLVLGDASWQLNGAPVADVDEVQIVPGDVLALNQPVTVTAIGDDLASVLTVDATDLSGDPELIEALDVSFTMPADDATWATAAGTNAFNIAPSNASYDSVNAGVTITFDEDTEDQVATDSTVNLSSVVFNLAQVAVGN
ncbi:alternate-type signal peptide domain-containing protein [Georgenia sp. MJ173]|uniref:alternate-type signal peptide domain-containing protein n=1 Tax=Georgenia sunbinii TaxID=3117728 RepID=UPI002F265263